MPSRGTLRIEKEIPHAGGLPVDTVYWVQSEMCGKKHLNLVPFELVPRIDGNEDVKDKIYLSVGI